MKLWWPRTMMSEEKQNDAHGFTSPLRRSVLGDRLAPASIRSIVCWSFSQRSGLSESFFLPWQLLRASFEVIGNGSG